MKISKEERQKERERLINEIKEAKQKEEQRWAKKQEELKEQARQKFAKLPNSLLGIQNKIKDKMVDKEFSKLFTAAEQEHLQIIQDLDKQLKKASRNNKKFVIVGVIAAVIIAGIGCTSLPAKESNVAEQSPQENVAVIEEIAENETQQELGTTDTAEGNESAVVADISETGEKEEPEETSEISAIKDAEEETAQITEPETVKTASYTLPSDVANSNGYLFKLSDVKAYDGSSAYCVLNNNLPVFSQEEYKAESFETYGSLDSLQRCTVCFACVGQDLMPTEDRGSIGSVKPSGWQTVKYDTVDGKYLYNRCHLIGYQLTAENANTRNLITGTRYLNINGMLPFENMVADYIKETGNHVLYKVTPVFEGNNLVASGVRMEALSVEDEGEGIMFNVFCYNVQPGITINYSDGASYLTAEKTEETTVVAGQNKESSSSETAKEETQQTTNNTPSSSSEKTYTFVLNTSTKKYHYPDCSDINRMSEKNKQTFTGTIAQVESMGYTLCGHCANRH